MRLTQRVPHDVVRFGKVALPWYWRRAYFTPHEGDIRPHFLYAIAGLHWLLILWHKRWEPVSWLVTAGLWEVEEGGYYKNGRFRWDFWRVRRARRERWAGYFGPETPGRLPIVPPPPKGTLVVDALKYARSKMVSP